ncbi:hypothetical protein NST28_15970 [Paenibacillus sp. FSL R10-2791]|uniref:hypothetical protein n=1 Tax=Paenibacillus sp. FSL R10-2791 TaxID=2954695 RepID=UPI0030F9BA6F
MPCLVMKDISGATCASRHTREGSILIPLLEYGHYIRQLLDRQSRQSRGVMIQQKQ